MDESEKKYMYQYQDHTPEERQACARKAGIASGKKRREMAESRKTCQILLNLLMADGKQYKTEKAESLNDVKGKNVTVIEALMLKQLEKASRGDTRALEFLLKQAGQDPQKLDMIEREERIAARNKEMMERYQEAQASAAEDSNNAITAFMEGLKGVTIPGVDDNGDESNE